MALPAIVSNPVLDKLVSFINTKTLLKPVSELDVILSLRVGSHQRFLTGERSLASERGQKPMATTISHVIETAVTNGIQETRLCVSFLGYTLGFGSWARRRRIVVKRLGYRVP